jgi:hypothetical protein
MDQRSRNGHQKWSGSAAVWIAGSALIMACTTEDVGYQQYADRVAQYGDDAVASVARYQSVDSTGAVTWDADTADRLERAATAFAGILRPDTTATLHRQMLDGIDSLVVAMRVLRSHQQKCGGERTIDCNEPRDFGRILHTMRRGRAIYLDARRRMQQLLATLGSTLPDPAVAARAG